MQKNTGREEFFKDLGKATFDDCNNRQDLIKLGDYMWNMYVNRAVHTKEIPVEVKKILAKMAVGNQKLSAADLKQAGSRLQSLVDQPVAFLGAMCRALFMILQNRQAGDAILIQYNLRINSFDQNELQAVTTDLFKEMERIYQIRLVSTTEVKKGHQAPLDLLPLEGVVACVGERRSLIFDLIAGSVDEPWGNIDLKTSLSSGATHLFFAAQMNNLEVAKLCLEAHCPIDAARKDGATPLMVAAYQGHADMVELLLTHKSDLKRTGPQGFTATDFAIKAQQVSVLYRSISALAKQEDFAAINELIRSAKEQSCMFDYALMREALLKSAVSEDRAQQIAMSSLTTQQRKNKKKKRNKKSPGGNVFSEEEQACLKQMQMLSAKFSVSLAANKIPCDGLYRFSSGDSLAMLLLAGVLSHVNAQYVLPDAYSLFVQYKPNQPIVIEETTIEHFQSLGNFCRSILKPTVFWQITTDWSLKDADFVWMYPVEHADRFALFFTYLINLLGCEDFCRLNTQAHCLEIQCDRFKSVDELYSIEISSKLDDACSLLSDCKNTIDSLEGLSKAVHKLISQRLTHQRELDECSEVSLSQYPRFHSQIKNVTKLPERIVAQPKPKPVKKSASSAAKSDKPETGVKIAQQPNLDRIGVLPPMEPFDPSLVKMGLDSDDETNSDSLTPN